MYVEQDELSYKKIIEQLKPDFVVHGDDWQTGNQASVREEVFALVSSYGGQVIEFPYTNDININVLEGRFVERYMVPEIRRGMLKKLLKLKKPISVLEAHNGLTGLIVENTQVNVNGGIKQFDAMWVSSLCDSSSRGKPDIELVDISKRIERINEIMEVTTKPIILDGDTGGLAEHFVYNVQTLERLGVSAIIIEDKIGLKMNSLFGTDVEQTQDTIENFSEKIKKGKEALRTNDFMIIARIESLILGQGVEDALKRALAYVEAGADGIMIHSKEKSPDEVYEFAEKFRLRFPTVCLVAVPTTYNSETEADLAAHGIDIVIHANHLLRSAFPAMEKVAQKILLHGSTKCVEEDCMPIKDVISFIPLK